jgi:hypothetical protein
MESIKITRNLTRLKVKPKSLKWAKKNWTRFPVGLSL